MVSLLSQTASIPGSTGSIRSECLAAGSRPRRSPEFATADAPTRDQARRPAPWPSARGPRQPRAPIVDAPAEAGQEVPSSGGIPAVTLSLRHIAAFLAVVDTGSYRAAAHRLNYSEPGIHHQVQSLERQLGLRLFVRVGRSVQLSRDGERLAPYCRSVLTAIVACLEVSRAGLAEDMPERIRHAAG